MKSIRCIVTAIAIFLSASSLNAQVSTADSLIQKVFATLKAKDQKAFVALYPNAQQFGRFIRNIMEQTMKSEEMKKLMAMDEKSKGMNLDSLIEAQVAAVTSAEGFGKMEGEFGKAFQKIIEKGEQKGVNWSEAKLTGFTIDSVAMGEKEGIPFGITGLKEAKGVIDFTVGDSAYQLAYNKMMYIQSEGGWFGADFAQLARKGESLEPDASASLPDDSRVMVEDEPINDPANKKAKTKTSTSKTKVKTKTPAKKTKPKS
jgi:citrate lyase gamma subunit